MAVDTYMFPASARIYLTVNAKTPLAAGNELLQIIDRDQVYIAWEICCVARKPKYEEGGLQHACKWFQQNVVGRDKG
jgi:endonuclease III